MSADHFTTDRDLGDEATLAEEVRYSWYGHALMGAHEYGDIRIVDGRIDRDIFACDSETDAEALCRLLNQYASGATWDA